LTQQEDRDEDKTRATRKRIVGTDNLCKYLAETYPEQFAAWALGRRLKSVEVLKTELSIEPVRADSVMLLKGEGLILHLEFQVEAISDPPLPLRMLDYWVRLHRLYRMPVHQALILLKPTKVDVPDEFRAERTSHRYDVVRMWEQEPEELLKREGLIPLAVLGRMKSAQGLLTEVAERVGQVREKERRRELSGCAQLLAGLRFEKVLIRKFFREGVMRESVIYQEIVEEGLREGLQKGLQQGLQQEALTMVMRLLTRLLGKVDVRTRRRIEKLSLSQLEDLGEALLDFREKSDLTRWLNSQQSRNE
jgi:predicted transposase/invertase (TIGR01784 family)